MPSPKFSKLQAIRFGWNTTLHNFKFFLLVLGVVAGVSLLPRIINFIEVPIFLSILIGAIFWIVNSILLLGVIAIVLKFAKNEKPVIQDLFSKKHLFFKYIFSNTLVAILTLIGFLFFIIPGIILAVRLQFYGYFIVENEVGPIDAIKKSWNLTKGSFWNLFLFGLLSGGIQILGIVALLIGLVFTTPTVWIARAVVYEKLKANKSQKNLE